MSILVTGSSGGIGGNVVRMLLEAGEEVVGFDVAPAGPGSVAADVADPFPASLRKRHRPGLPDARGPTPRR